MLTTDIASLALGTVSGNLTVSLIGLSHTWIGDLRGTLQHVDTGTSRAFFTRVGDTTGSSFGDPSDLSGTYRFNNSFTGDLWTTALGTVGAVPGGDYFPSAPLNGSAIDLSNFFNGESAAGTWRLTVTDLSGGDIGSLGSWELSFETGVVDDKVVPEPSTLVPMFLCALGLAGALRSRRQRA